jgi:hypothetical protein
MTTWLSGQTIGMRARLAALAAGGAAMGLLGPFGSYVGMSTPIRLLHFSVAMTVVGALNATGLALARRAFPARAGSICFSLAIVAALAPVGAGPVMAMLAFWSPGVLNHVGYGELVIQVAAISIGIVVVFTSYERRASASPRLIAVPIERGAPVDLGALAAKLPFALRGAAIEAFSAEDHYLRVRTARGEALILAGIGEAEALMGKKAGIRIHRSHWVAADAVAEVSRDAVRLKSGVSLPVSRRGYVRLAERGYS